jgi:membrane protein
MGAKANMLHKERIVPSPSWLHPKSPSLQKGMRVIQGVIRKLDKDEVGVRAAALAYYGLLSLFPLLLFMVFLASPFLESTSARTSLNNYISQVLPTATETVQQVINQTLEARGSIGLIGGIGLLWSASALFNALSTSFNVIWDAKPRSFWRRRLLATVSVLTIGVLFILSVAFSALAVIRLPGDGIPLWRWINFGVGMIVTILLFWLLFHGIPNTAVNAKASLSAAVLAAILWQAAKGIFAWYLASGLSNYGAVYGSLASVIALILWTYLSAFILFFGVEFGASLQRELWPNARDKNRKSRTGRGVSPTE